MELYTFELRRWGWDSSRWNLLYFTHVLLWTVADWHRQLNFHVSPDLLSSIGSCIRLWPLETVWFVHSSKLQDAPFEFYGPFLHHMDLDNCKWGQTMAVEAVLNALHGYRNLSLYYLVQPMIWCSLNMETSVVNSEILVIINWQAVVIECTAIRSAQPTNKSRTARLVKFSWEMVSALIVLVTCYKSVVKAVRRNVTTTQILPLDGKFAEQPAKCGSALVVPQLRHWQLLWRIPQPEVKTPLCTTGNARRVKRSHGCNFQFSDFVARADRNWMSRSIESFCQLTHWDNWWPCIRNCQGFGRMSCGFALLARPSYCRYGNCWWQRAYWDWQTDFSNTTRC